MFTAVAFFACVALAIVSFYRFLDWAWFKPKKLEKCLRDQGFKGNSYRLFLGDQYESGKMIREALSKSIGVDDDIKKRIMPHILKTFDTYGKNSFMWVGRIPRLNIRDPALVREIFTKYYIFHKNHHDLDPITKILLTGVGSLEGETWVKRRRILNPAFYFEKLKLLMPTFYLNCLQMVSKWEKLVPEEGSREVDVWHDIENLTGDVISRALFGISYEEEGQHIFELMKELTALTTEVIQSVHIPGRRFFPTKTNRRMKAIDKEIKIRMTAMIEKKTKAMKGGEHSGDDFLGMLLECNNNVIRENGNNKNAGMSIDDIISECKLIYFAGPHTMSSCLVWTMILLSRFPDWQVRAREEVFEYFGDRQPDHDGINHLKLVTMILNEVLRLYPPVAEMTKVAQEDVQLGNYMIPAGVEVMMPAVFIQHDPEIWGKDAMEFNPQRFEHGILKAAKDQGAFFPFSLGPRMCIGQNFAMLELKMALALILRRFTFELSPSYAHAPFTLFTIHPQYGAPLIMRKL